MVKHILIILFIVTLVILFLPAVVIVMLQKKINFKKTLKILKGIYFEKL
jgi:putative effector of murein hydrolase LrgA (UPF0299 family)